jgi:hypothetical protein
MTHITRVPGLNECMTEAFPGLLERFRKQHRVSVSRARDLFNETQKWLWLCAKHNEDRKNNLNHEFELCIYQEMRMLEEMWHNFILFLSSW